MTRVIVDYETNEENAYCREDGAIVVCGGMMGLFADEDEFAAVVAHELGHKIAKHSGEKIPAKEIEADEIGLRLMVRDGYDPRAAGRFWRRYYERINWWEGDGTHEDPMERVARLERLGGELGRK